MGPHSKEAQAFTFAAGLQDGAGTMGSTGIGNSNGDVLSAAVSSGR